MRKTVKTKTVYNLEYIKKNIKKGSDWCIRLAVFSIIAAVVSEIGAPKNNMLTILGFERFALFDGIIILLIGYGIYLKSRIVIGAGFAFYILERTYMWLQWHRTGNILFLIIVVFAVITSMKLIGVYSEIRKSYLIKKNILILNILALLYSTVVALTIIFLVDYFSQLTVSEILIGHIPYSRVETTFDAYLTSYFIPALISCMAVAYVSTLTKHLPFTKDRDMSRYQLSEESVIDVKLKDRYFSPAIYHAIVPAIILVLGLYISIAFSIYITMF